MNCYFCQSLMTPQQPYADPYNYACSTCPREVVHRYRYEVGSDTNPYLFSVTWYACCNDKEYRITFNFTPGGANYCFVYSSPYDNPRAPIARLILKFPFLPPITPTNCDEKLLTYLTFL